jgi:hypothetical protein
MEVPESFAALRRTAKTNNDKSKKATAKAKYRGLSTAPRTIGPSAASVEMTFRSDVEMTFR